MVKILIGAAFNRGLSAPFPTNELHWKPKLVKGNRALAIAYVDARSIQDRLDEVLGVDGWQDAYRELANGSVVCRLRLQIGGKWISKSDVGSPSEQSDAGDRTKAAFSDALKRAAVKFGVGRYLYRLPVVWADYDPQTKRLVKVPQLPSSAVSAAGANQRPLQWPELAPTPAPTLQPSPAPDGAPRASVAIAPPARPSSPKSGDAAAPRSPELLKWDEVSKVALGRGVVTNSTLAKWLAEYGVGSVGELGPKPLGTLTRRLQSLVAA